MQANFNQCKTANKGSGGQASCMWWTSNSAVRFGGGIVNIPRARRFLLTWEGTDTAATTAKVYIGGSLAGTTPAFVGGSAASAGSTTGSNVTLPVVFESGAHAIDIQYDAAAGNIPGIASISLKSY